MAGPSVMSMENKQVLLTSVQMARFVARGSVRLDAVVPEQMNAEGLATLAEGVPSVPYGTPLSQAYEKGSFVHQLLEIPRVAGALRSLVGPEPTIDHHAVHIREPHGGEAHPPHGDPIIATRPAALDAPPTHYPQAPTGETGRTLTAPARTPR